MSYLTWDEYRIEFQGSVADQEEFARLLPAAELLVEEMTVYRLTPLSFSAMDDEQKEAVERAVCFQVDYLAETGMDLLEGSQFQSASLGKFNYTMAAGDGGSGQTVYAPLAVHQLIKTGLCYRGG